jgi:hypothetical protein
LAKTKTPTPPKRPVQAPKRRDTRSAAPIRGRALWLAVAGAVAAVAIAVGLYFAFHNSNSSAAPAAVAHQAKLPGLITGPPPWQPEIAHLAFRLDDIGLPILSAEALAYHIHQHLDIWVNGKKVPVPADVGIDPGAQQLTVIHTHDSSGIIHVESPVKKTYTLGQFFDVWGLRFTSKCIGGECATATKPLRVWVDGKLWHGNPRLIPLKAHSIFVVAYGKKPPKIRTKYAWAGL